RRRFRALSSPLGFVPFLCERTGVSHAGVSVFCMVRIVRPPLHALEPSGTGHHPLIHTGRTRHRHAPCHDAHIASGHPHTAVATTHHIVGRSRLPHTGNAVARHGFYRGTPRVPPGGPCSPFPGLPGFPRRSSWRHAEELAPTRPWRRRNSGRCPLGA